MAMRWSDLLFAHWPVDVARLRRLVPSALEIDTYDGAAWLGIVPFCMSGVRPRFVPAVPGFSAFPELNVRTYVVCQGKPGVWFFSLDAARRWAVRLARRFIHLPYYDAAMSCRRRGDAIEYSSVRTHQDAPTAEFAATYGPTGPVYRSQPGSLDSWLTDRFCMYVADGQGRAYRGEIDHGPWPLQRAEAEIRTCQLTRHLGISLGGDPLLHFARRVDAVAWFLEPCD